MKQIINLLFLVTLFIQLVASYLLAFFTLFVLFGVFNLGASATTPDPLWAVVLVYTITALVMGLGMLGVGWGSAKLRKQILPGLYHYLGAVIAGGLGWAWLESTPMGQTRSPLVLVAAIFVGYYLPDIVGLFSGGSSEAQAVE